MTRIIDGKDNLVISSEILHEVFFVMARPKFKISHQHINRFVNSIKEIAHSVPYLGTIKGVCRDTDDEKILECAVLGDVDFIISGDSDLLSLEEFRGIPILTASEYLKKVENHKTC
jgi:putative PIN family toxin of toxin-antitoxin system